MEEVSIFSFASKLNEIIIRYSDILTSDSKNRTEQEPIIVIDLSNLTHVITSDPKETICGGRHQSVLHSFENMMKAFEAIGSVLVFFIDLNEKEERIDRWIRRHNTLFNKFTDIYNRIASGVTLDNLAADSTDTALSSSFYGMNMIASKYGKFRYSIKRDCEQEMAQYATRKNAIAVLSNNTDFLIYEGPWQLWSPQYIKMSNNIISTTEYSRSRLANDLSISEHQLSLFASLMQNDFTEPHYKKLNYFHI